LGVLWPIGVDARERLAENIRDQRNPSRHKPGGAGVAVGVHPTEVSRLERRVRDSRFSTILRVPRALMIRSAEPWR
jgi:hypothetical protein